MAQWQSCSPFSLEATLSNVFRLHRPKKGEIIKTAMAFYGLAYGFAATLGWRFRNKKSLLL